MSEMQDHFCPGCGKAQRAFARYPWYFCQTCLDTAQDGDGRGLEFANAAPAGGLIWRHSGGTEADWSDEAGTVLCLIRGRPVCVNEARFGGVVAEPLRSGPPNIDAWKLTDLRRGAR